MQLIGNEEGSAGNPRQPGYDRSVEVESLLLTLDDLGIETAHFVGWSSGGEALMDFGVVYPERLRSVTLVEPSSYWILLELDERDAHQDKVNAFLDSLAGKSVTEGDLAIFLANLGVLDDPATASDHPKWPTWLPHRMALSWRSVGDPFPTRSIEGLKAIASPALLVQGTSTARWRKRVLEILDANLPQSTVVEVEGGHSAFTQSIDEFLAVLEAHLH